VNAEKLAVFHATQHTHTLFNLLEHCRQSWIILFVARRVAVNLKSIGLSAIKEISKWLKSSREGIVHRTMRVRTKGLMPAYSSSADRFEVDGANAARDFLKERNIPHHDLDTFSTAIAPHTTQGIPQYMDPVVALVTAE
jgi:hypothetical protein